MKKSSSLRKILMSLCMGTAICGFSMVAHGQQMETNKIKKNPFVKPPTMLPNGAPQGLPRDDVQVVMPPVNAAVDPNSPEEKEAKFEWTKMRIVGYIDNNVLLRVEDLNNNNNNNNNNNSGNNNNNNQPITILATLDKKFFFNKNFYTLKKEKNYFIVYNKSNKPMHSMTLDSSPTRLIQHRATNGASGNQGANSVSGK